MSSADPWVTAVPGTGAGFESPYRAGLLLELGRNDKLELYSERGEDADVIRSDASRTVHQSRAASRPGRMRS